MRGNDPKTLSLDSCCDDDNEVVKVIGRQFRLSSINNIRYRLADGKMYCVCCVFRQSLEEHALGNDLCNVV